MSRSLLALAIVALLGGTAHADDELDPALIGHDVRICRGIVTSNGTCIGSESNIAPPLYEGETIYRRQGRRVRGTGRAGTGDRPVILPTGPR
jgi:hypothetical protein